MATKNSKNTLLLALFGAVLLVTIYLVSQYQSFSFEQKIARLESQSTSTETESIENDLDTTDLTEIDAELAEIEKEINSSY